MSGLRFLEEPQAPALYRVHEGPTPEKLEALRTFLKQFGLDLTGGDNAAREGLWQAAREHQGPSHNPAVADGAVAVR